MRKIYEFDFEDYSEELAGCIEMGLATEIEDGAVRIEFMGECDGVYEHFIFKELMNTDDDFHDEFMSWYSFYAGMDHDSIARLCRIRTNAAVTEIDIDDGKMCA